MGWNTFYLVVPVILIRFGVMALVNIKALKQAGFFPPMERKEKLAFQILTITQILLYAGLIFTKLNTQTNWTGLGFVLYLDGLVVYTAAIVQFAHPGKGRIKNRGLYRFSRNPMYLAYFIVFLGIGLLIASWVYLLILAVFQIATHWLILAEERWCLQEFGDQYQKYKKQVRRYL